MPIQIQKPDIRTITFNIKGTNPLICHKWDEKTEKEMLDKQMKKKVGPRKAKNPEAEYKASLYKLSGGTYGFPAVGFKSAAVRAAKMVDGMTMIDTQQMFHVLADENDCVRIKGTPTMRKDMVRLQGQTADIRFRGEFREWEATLNVEYNAGVISDEQLCNLFELAGFSVGVGEWRVTKSGSFGTFTLLENNAA